MEKEVDRLFQRISRMQSDWHRIIGLEVNYYLGHLADKLLLMFITYKRVCDVFESQNADCQGCQFEYREMWTWGNVASQDSVVDALADAVEGINVANYDRIPYGESLIPVCHVPEGDKNSINNVLQCWTRQLNEINLDRNHVSDDEWLSISRRLRGSIKR